MEKIKWLAGIVIVVFLLSGCGSLGQTTTDLRSACSSGSESDIARAINQKLPRSARPHVAIAIIEKISGAPSQRLFAETTLRYYLDSCGFPVKDGENALLREYAGFYFSEKPRDFPLTLTSKYYIIGVASAEPGEDQSGLTGAKAELEIYALNRDGEAFYSRNVRTESLAFSLESAEIKALKTAVSEAAVQILPMLR
jgi:hypothetical protein